MWLCLKTSSCSGFGLSYQLDLYCKDSISTATLEEMQINCCLYVIQLTLFNYFSLLKHKLHLHIVSKKLNVVMSCHSAKKLNGAVKISHVL